MMRKIDQRLQHSLMFGIVSFCAATVDIAATWLDGNVLVEIGVSPAQPPPIQQLNMLPILEPQSVGAIIVAEYKSVIGGGVRSQAADIGVVIVKTSERKRESIERSKAIAKVLSNEV